MTKSTPTWVPTWLPVADVTPWRLVDLATGSFYRDEQGHAYRFIDGRAAVKFGNKHGLRVMGAKPLELEDDSTPGDK